MLKKLKRTFVLLSATLTGLVLLLACALAFFFTKAQIVNAGNEAFENQSQTLSVLLAGTNHLDHNQIAQMERENGIFSYLFDNGNPVRVASGDDDTFRASLYDAALTALDTIDSNTIVLPSQRYGEPVNYTASFFYDNSDYLAKFISMPTGARQWYSIVLVKPLTGRCEEISRLMLLYSAIFVGGLALLVLISWVLAKRSVQPVEDAQERQKDFIAAASHELKSPLAVILSSVDVLENSENNLTDGLHTIKNEIKRMSCLVEDMLLLAGAETGKWTVKTSSVNIDDILVEAYERHLSLAQKKDISLKLELPNASLPEIVIDAERIQQVLSILFSNAIAYSPKGSTVILKCEEQQNKIIIALIDNGIGISNNDKVQIFKKFYRTQHAHSDKSHFGLGLAVAQELVALHNGTLSVSDTDGGGATFTIALPKYNSY